MTKFQCVVKFPVNGSKGERIRALREGFAAIVEELLDGEGVPPETILGWLDDMRSDFELSLLERGAEAESGDGGG